MRAGGGAREEREGEEGSERGREREREGEERVISEADV
jgi:hypothetical protein